MERREFFRMTAAAGLGTAAQTPGMAQTTVAGPAPFIERASPGQPHKGKVLRSSRLIWTMALSSRAARWPSC